MAGTSSGAGRRGASRRLVVLLGAVPLGCLFAVGAGTPSPTAHADTPKPPPASSPADTSTSRTEPVDELVGGGDRTLTWLALAGAGTVAIAAGGIVVLAGQRRARPAVGADGAVGAGGADEPVPEERAERDGAARGRGDDSAFLDLVLTEESAPASPRSAAEPQEPASSAGEVASETDSAALEADIGATPPSGAQSGAPTRSGAGGVGAGPDPDDDPEDGRDDPADDDAADDDAADDDAADDESDAVPRRGLVAPSASEAAPAHATSGHGPDGGLPARRREVDLDAVHLDDPLVLDAGIRPRRALPPIPDSSANVASSAADDTSWSDWYESAEEPSRRGRRALPSESDGEAIPRRARQ